MEKLIDTDALEGGKFHSIEDWTPVEIASWQRGWNDAIDAIISNVSTVDAEEVVRCKDCRWSCWNNCECIRNRLYRHNSISLEGESYFRKIEPDDFCSWGERREDETD